MYKVDSIIPLKTISVPSSFFDRASSSISRAIITVEYADTLIKENKSLAELGGTYQRLYEEKKIQLKEHEKIASDCEEMKTYHAQESAKRYKALLKEERRKKMWKMGTVATGGFALGYVLLNRLGLIR